MRLLRCGGALALLALLPACSLSGPEPDKFGAREVSFAEMDGWAQDNHLEALASFNASCPVLARKPRAQTSGSGIKIPASVWSSLCDEAKFVEKKADPQAARQFFEFRFVPYRVNNRGKETGLFTGYYEPMLYGSYTRKGPYQYPVYAAPANMKKPYFSHAQINKGALRGKGLELAWVDDPVMLFFMQIQGSGRIRMVDGSVLHVGYAGQNGHEYLSIGKVMGDEGILPKDQINFFTIRQWLYDNPKRAFSVMERNPSFVFFKKSDKKGAVGAVGVELTPRRSVAIDSKHIPYGLPVFISTELPSATSGGAGQPFKATLIAQDTGGAIRSPVRGDIFFGVGMTAEYMAGNMKGRGTYELLVPREVAYQLR